MKTTEPSRSLQLKRVEQKTDDNYDTLDNIGSQNYRIVWTVLPGLAELKGCLKNFSTVAIRKDAATWSERQLERKIGGLKWKRSTCRNVSKKHSVSRTTKATDLCQYLQMNILMHEKMDCDKHTFDLKDNEKHWTFSANSAETDERRRCLNTESILTV